MDIVEKLRKRNELLEKKEAMENLIKDYNKEIESFEWDILNEARRYMVDEISVDGQRYKIEPAFNYFPVEKESSHDKKVELLERLAEMGSEDIVFFKSGYMPRVKFKSFLKSLPIETIQGFKNDGILNVIDTVSITKSRKKK